MRELQPGDVVVFVMEGLPVPSYAAEHQKANGIMPSANAVVRKVHDDGTIDLQLGVTREMFEPMRHALRAGAEPKGEVFERVPDGAGTQTSRTFKVVQ